jgi:hypothetical protein
MMMKIPPDIKIPLCIEQGSVFNFYIDFNDSRRESKNRFFIIMNRNPADAVILIMITPTTKIEKVKSFIERSKISPKTVVEVKSGEHCIFASDSAFNCNNIFSVKMDDLIKKIEENGSMNYPKMPASIIKRLIVGVKESPEVSPDIKDLL